MSASVNSRTPVALTTADGTTLGALRYAVPGASAQHQGRIVVAGATGVAQRFYRRCAEHAAAQGWETMTLDYRGIGLSRPASLRGFVVDYRDWARQDLAAAVDICSADDLPLYIVGQSYGGHAVGLLPDPGRVAGLYTFGTGAGWHGWMPAMEQWRVQLMWRVLGPVLTRWKGYLPGALAGVGEDLPLGVYRQWRKWCSQPRYFFDDPDIGAEAAALFARVRMPIVAANALDDMWALRASRDAFMAGYVNAPWQGLDIDHRPYAQGLGHMGYFRPASQPLWQAALDWFGHLNLTSRKVRPHAHV